jgi:hypothetical protein
MSEHRETPMPPTARPARPDRVQTALPPDHRALARGGTWLRDGTVIRMPLRARLALVRPQMLKAQAGRPAGS